MSNFTDMSLHGDNKYLFDDLRDVLNKRVTRKAEIHL